MFRVSLFRICHIDRMENKTIHIAETEPDGTVLLKYIRGEASDAEKTCVEAWLQEDEENEKTLEQVARIFYAVRTEQRIMSRNSVEAYNKVRKQIAGRNRRFWLGRTSLAAACFMGVLILSSVLSYLWIQDSQKSVVPQMITVVANSGMRTHCELPDGTIAYLNSGSSLAYPIPYDEKERKVLLIGEAYFKVTHNSSHPFVVSVQDDKMRVRVLGTEFNLQAYREDETVQTTLVTGSVNIELVKQGNIFSEVNLKPSEKAVYAMSSGTLSISTVDTNYETAWKEGRLMFKDMPLPQVLKKLAYFYNVKFEVQDPVINSYCFTGTFENKQLSQILDYLKISSGIDYTIKCLTSDDSNSVQYETVILQKKK